MRAYWLVGVGLCAALTAACAKGSSEVDEGDDTGPVTTVGPGGAGGTNPVGPVGPGVGGAGNNPGPGPGVGGGGTGATGGAGGAGTGGAGTGGILTQGGAGGVGGVGGSGTGGGGGSTCTQVLLDTGFEAGSPNPTWTEQSTNLPTPLCTVADCGMGGGTGPRTGSWWFWGGGVAVALPNSKQEVGGVEQTITNPAGTATLDYYLQIPSCDTQTVPDLRDFFGVVVDGTVVYVTDTVTENTAGNCGVAVYQQRSINLNTYADGGAHTIRFEVDQLYDSFFSNGVSNFFVDDVALTACP